MGWSLAYAHSLVRFFLFFFFSIIHVLCSFFFYSLLVCACVHSFFLEKRRNTTNMHTREVEGSGEGRHLNIKLVPGEHRTGLELSGVLFLLLSYLLF